MLAPGAPLNCDYFEQQLYRPQLRFAARDFDLWRIATTAGAEYSASQRKIPRAAEPSQASGPGATYLDRLGILTAAAVALIVVAYGYRIWQHLQMPRFGSPGFSPF